MRQISVTTKECSAGVFKNPLLTLTRKGCQLNREHKEENEVSKAQKMGRIPQLCKAIILITILGLKNIKVTKQIQERISFAIKGFLHVRLKPTCFGLPEKNWRHQVQQQEDQEEQHTQEDIIVEETTSDVIIVQFCILLIFRHHHHS